VRLNTVRITLLGVLLAMFACACGQASAPPLSSPTPTVNYRQWLTKAEESYRQGRFAQALDDARHAIQLSPEDATAWEMARKAAVALAAQDYLSHLPADRYRISAAQFLADQANGRNFLIVDVREPEEFKQGHLEQAINLPLRSLLQKPHPLPASFSEPILVYCRSQKRSTHALVALRELGYTQVFNLEGGYLAYQEYLANHATPTPGPTPTLDPAKNPDQDGGC